MPYRRALPYRRMPWSGVPLYMQHNLNAPSPSPSPALSPSLPLSLSISLSLSLSSLQSRTSSHSSSSSTSILHLQTGQFVPRSDIRTDGQTDTQIQK